MAIKFREIEWIVSDIVIHRKAVKDQSVNDAIVSITVSFGAKEMENGEIALSPVSGAELWRTLADKTFHATIRDVLAFSEHLGSSPDSQYAPAAPEGFGFFSLDAWVSGPIYGFTAWMLDSGRWSV